MLMIFELAQKHKTPVFSSSSLRYSTNLRASLADPKLGKVLGCVSYSPCSLEPHHPDLFWYGIHGVEPLFAIMGPGCESVSRTDSPLSTVSMAFTNSSGEASFST